MKFSFITFWRSITLLLLTIIFICVPVAVLADGVLNLTVHYIQATPADNHESYRVSAFVSVLDDNGLPVHNLSLSNFSVFEDSQTLPLKTVNQTADVPISLILVFDTSGSMFNSGLPQAKKAGANFIQKLGAGDQVAIIGFNESVGSSSGFTSDKKSVLNQLDGLKSIPNAGTCLYDAAYKAVEMANTLPPGRRVVILLTDGRDETMSKKICSTYTVDDVIAQANGKSGNIPVYTIGLGSSIDEGNLKRIAGLTGGEYLSSPIASQLGTLFDKLSQQIKEQYEITFESTGTPGAHKLTVEVAIGAQKDQATREFSLPKLPAGIKIQSPVSGITLGGPVEINPVLTGSEDDVKAVRFEVAGNPVSTVTGEPFSLKLDLSKYPDGNLEIVAVALGSENQELARNGIKVIVANQVLSPAVAPGVSLTPIVTPPSSWPSQVGLLGLLVGLGVILLLVIILVSILRRKKPAVTPGPESGFPVSPSSEETLDGFDLNNLSILATLTVLFSDDRSQIGMKIPISNQTTRLGRDKTQNDIVFENDRPVSREHATITLTTAGQFVLADVIREIAGQPGTGPTYGTYVNETRLTAPVLLYSGDEIRLGNRLKLLFESQKKGALPSESTDEFSTLDDSGDETNLSVEDEDTKTVVNPVDEDTKTMVSVLDDTTKLP